MKSTRMWLAGITVCIAVSPALADGPGAYRPREQPAIVATPEESAIDAYNAGYASIQRADAAEKAASTATDERARTGAQRDAQRAYKDSLKHFNVAVRGDPSMHEAYTYIGYANRKIGRYDAALNAYSRALKINPNYPHAIEYQGQAYLGLNRIEEAKVNYLRLYAIAPSQADKLLAAMQRWVDANRGKTSGAVDVDQFAAWISQQAQSAAARPDAARGSSSSW